MLGNNSKTRGAAALVVSLFIGCGAALADTLPPSPTAVFTKYREVLMKASSVDAILPYMSKKVLDQINASAPADKPMFFGLIKATTPNAVHILSEKIDGDKAVIKLTGDSDEKSPNVKETISGTVNFVKENGAWKLEHEAYNSKVTDTGNPPAALPGTASDSPAK